MWNGFKNTVNRKRAGLYYLVSPVFIFLSCAEVLVVPSLYLQRQDLTQYLSTNAHIEPLDDSVVTASVDGRIQSIAITEGARVIPGAIIATIENDAISSHLKKTEALLDASKAALQQAQHVDAVEIENIRHKLSDARHYENAAEEHLASIERLAAQKAIPRRKLEEARSALSVRKATTETLAKQWEMRSSALKQTYATAKVAEASEAYRVAKQQLHLSALRATTEGTLYSITVNPGDYVHQGTVIARIGNLDSVRVIVFIDEPDLGHLTHGLKAILNTDTFPEMVWNCYIDRLPAQIVAFNTRKVGEAVCTVHNPENKLLPGLSLNARLESARAKNVLTVPRDALVYRDGISYLWLRDHEGRAKRQPVELGLQTDSKIEVRSGVSEGDQVLLLGGVRLKPGQKVRTEVE